MERQIPRQRGPQPHIIRSRRRKRISIPRLTKEVQRLIFLHQAVLKSLSKKLNDERPGYDSPSEDSNTPGNDQRTKKIGKEPPTIVDTCFYNLAAFLNRKNVVKGDFVIEALMTTIDWESEIEEEQNRYSTMKGNDELDEIYNAPGAIVSSGIEAFGEDMRLGAVRIQSSTILHAFSEFTSYTNPAKSILFSRPFITFWATYEQMKTKLAKMEKAVAAYQNPEHSFLDLDHQGSGDPDNDPLEVDGVRYTDSHIPTKRSLQDMRCYIQFVETRILPIWNSFKSREGPGPKLVTFEDLPCLFTEGDLIYLPKHDSHQINQSAFQCVWRLKAFLLATWLRRGEIWLYGLDYDGKSVMETSREIRYNYFSGVKDVTTLPCYPLSLHVNVTDILEEANNIGSRFLLCTQKYHRGLFYSGWTLVKGIFGEQLQDEERRPVTTADYTESEIIVDFNEALRNYPVWSLFSSPPLSQ